MYADQHDVEGRMECSHGTDVTVFNLCVEVWTSGDPRSIVQLPSMITAIQNI